MIRKYAEESAFWSVCFCLALLGLFVSVWICLVCSVLLPCHGPFAIRLVFCYDTPVLR